MIKPSFRKYKKLFMCLIKTYKKIFFFSIIANDNVPDPIKSNWDIQYFSIEPLLSKGFNGVSNAMLNIFVPALPGIMNNYLIQERISNTSQSSKMMEEEIWIEVQYVKWNQKLMKAILVQTDVARRWVSSQNGGWIQLDVTEIVNGVWLNNPNNNMGLHIQVKTKSGQTIPIGIQYQTTNVS